MEEGSQTAEIAIYEAETGLLRWKQSVLSRPISNVFEEGEPGGETNMQKVHIGLSTSS